MKSTQKLHLIGRLVLVQLCVFHHGGFAVLLGMLFFSGFLLGVPYELSLDLSAAHELAVAHLHFGQFLEVVQGVNSFLD